ncbi:hypothetical protein [Leptospira santarosai]|uniref:hypothetical protein n=1 Tax=Leptospira santarosai TaxID=28183 RepID=UPI0024AEBB0F|nr:hypothetical protein [Leptospira santarosai]MDI7215715.1 hypothetical protein [Leptospira santarosai]
MKHILQAFPFLLCFLSFHCIFSTVPHIAESSDSKFQSVSSNKKERIVFLIQGAACIELCKETDTNSSCIKKNPDQTQSCKEFAPGWYPVEFAREENYFRVSSLYPDRKKTFIHNIPAYLLQTYPKDGKQRQYYDPVESLAQFHSQNKKGFLADMLIVKLNSYDREMSVSGFFSVGSLLLIPGYFEERFYFSASHYDSNGKETQVSVSPLILRNWLGWLFFLWGPIASSGDKQLLGELFRFILDKN